MHVYTKGPSIYVTRDVAQSLSKHSVCTAANMMAYCSISLNGYLRVLTFLLW